MRIVAAAAVLLGLFYAGEAGASGTASPPGSYMPLARERSIVVWDAEKKVEHFVYKPAFEGDARDFGFLVPTPTVPVIAKIATMGDDVFRGTERLLPHFPVMGAHEGVEVAQRVQLDDFEIATLRASDAGALGDWLKAHGFVDRPTLRLWSQRYLARGFFLNAMRYAPASGDPGKHQIVETPAVRFSFTIDAPFYPYTEASPEPADEHAFLARHPDAHVGLRSLDLWVVAAEPMQAFEGKLSVEQLDSGGPIVAGTAHLTPDGLTVSLGDTRAWGFDARSRPDWFMTYFHEEGSARTAFDDLVFRPANAANGAVAEDDREMAPGANMQSALGVLVLGVLAFALGVAFRDHSQRG